MSDRMTDAVDMDSLIAAFWDSQREYFESLFISETEDDILRRDAIDLGVIAEDEELILTDGEEEYVL